MGIPNVSINLNVIIEDNNHSATARIWHPLLKGELYIQADSVELLNVQLDHIIGSNKKLEPNQFQDIITGIKEIGNKVGEIRKMIGR